MWSRSLEALKGDIAIDSMLELADSHLENLCHPSTVEEVHYVMPRAPEYDRLHR